MEETLDHCGVKSCEVDLTSRERQVAELVARGFSNKSVAFNLGISASTVASHVRSLRTKLCVSTRLDVCRVLLSEATKQVSEEKVIKNLSSTQMDIARRLVSGHTVKDIARWRGCRPRTVEKHIEGIYKALGVSSRTALLQFLACP